MPFSICIIYNTYLQKSSQNVPIIMWKSAMKKKTAKKKTEYARYLFKIPVLQLAPNLLLSRKCSTRIILQLESNFLEKVAIESLYSWLLSVVLIQKHLIIHHLDQLCLRLIIEMGETILSNRTSRICSLYSIFSRSCWGIACRICTIVSSVQPCQFMHE